MFSFKQLFLDVELELKETDKGYALEFQGSKEDIKARLEALVAFVEFKQKAAAAGLNYGQHDHFKKMHDRFREMHKRNKCCE